MNNGRHGKNTIAEQKLKALQKATEEDDAIVDIVLQEFIDKVNRGEEVDEEALLEQCPPQLREKLEKELRFSRAMSALGEDWREQKRMDATA